MEQNGIQNITSVSTKVLEKSHPMIEKCIIDMISANYLPFYGEFALYLAFIESKQVPTMGVTVNSRGPRLYWNPEFTDKLTLPEMNFIIVHEIMHLLLDHVERSVGYDHKLANLAQDMIINTIIYEDCVLGDVLSGEEKIRMPQHEYEFEDGSKQMVNTGIFVPKEYDGDLIFESLYYWLKQRYEEYKSKNSVVNSSETEENSEILTFAAKSGKINKKNFNQIYGPYSKEIKGKKKTMTPDMFSLDHWFEDLERSKGMTLDAHLPMEDGITKQVKREIVERIVTNLKNRGVGKGTSIDETLRKLRKSEKDYLKEIKRTISNIIIEGFKKKNITRPNRRDIWGLKGKRKYKIKINCILDTSGSMCGEFDKVLSYIFQNEIFINLIQVDSDVQSVEEIRNKKDLNKFALKGFGGTELTPGLQFIANDTELNKYNTVVLTDGYTDTLDLSGVRGSVLIISTAKECGIVNSNTLVKQIVIDKSEE